MDDRLRTLARSTRAEIEAAIDVDAELRALAGRPPAATAPGPAAPPDRSRAAVWLAAVAAAAVAVVGGVWLFGADDAAIRTTEPATTPPPPATAVTTTPTGASTVPPATTAPSATAATSSGTCTDIKAHDVGVGGIAGLIVDARLAGQAPRIDGCLVTVPAAFDGRAGRCWSCPGLTFADRPVVVDTVDGGFTFQLAVSAPDGDTVVDVVETWRFDLVDGLLVFGGVQFDAPLVHRDDSLATIIAYFEAIESGAWSDAALMLDDGAQNAEERADVRRLEPSDYSPESIAAALERWCASGCATEPPSAADLEFNGYTHDLVRSGERIRVRWYEGNLSIDGLPPRRTDASATEPGSEPETGAVDWRTLSFESTKIAHDCEGSTSCTRVLHAPDGTPVSLDPGTRRLTRHSTPPVSVTLPEEYGERSWLYHAGPDGVVYLQVAPAEPAELAADVVAVTLSPGDAGREIARWADVVDAIGDRELVGTPAGLVLVGCCGPDTVRPAPGAAVSVPWVDRSGAPVESATPGIEVALDGAAMTVRRTGPLGTSEWSFTPEGEPFLRGMPQVTPTFDGGFVAALYGERTTLVRGWPDGDVEQVVLVASDATMTVALDPNGRALIGDGDRFARVEPFADRTVRPTGEATIDVEAGTVTLPDLSGITADWLADPVAFGAAVRGPLAVNEQRTIEAEQRTGTEWLVIVTTSNFFDDSVLADRWELVLDRGSDDRLAFVSGTWSNACQPGRGHQDFRPTLCT